jgi:ABC-type glycerol-3-phosphate transport system substrate-binding protein
MRLFPLSRDDGCLEKRFPQGGNMQYEKSDEENIQISKKTIAWVSAIGILLLGCLCVLLMLSTMAGGYYFLVNKNPLQSAVITAEMKTPVPGETVQPTDTVEQPTATTEPTQARNVTILWWHINTDMNQGALWQQLANEYTADHPNVTIEITVMENESLKPS